MLNYVKELTKGEGSVDRGTHKEMQATNESSREMREIL